MDEYDIDTLNLDSLSPAGCATILLEFLKDLPEPLVSTLYKPFLNVLKAPTEAIQLNELKLLVKQMPNPNRETLACILDTLAVVDALPV